MGVRPNTSGRVHYSVTIPDLTLDKFIEQLQRIQAAGAGDEIPQVYDPDYEDWAPITGFTYGDGIIRFYGDEP